MIKYQGTCKSGSGIDRRTFLRNTAVAAGGVAAFSTFFNMRDAEAATTGENSPDAASAAAGQSIVYRFSVCQNCHARCGIMGKIVGTSGSTDAAAGVLVKLEGNPYHPQNMEEDERLGWGDSVTTAAQKPGRLCPKGQAGVQVLYDPYRIKHPLKRVGERGSGKWQTVSWSTAFSEIATKINQLIPTATRLTTRVNVAIPLMGPISNGLMFSPGRSTDSEIIERIFKNTYGTSNYRLDHTSICEVSHHVSNELMTWEGGKKNHFKPDIMESEYLVLFGANYLEANFPMLALARKIAEFKKAGKKLIVVDPRFSNTAAKANRWIPAKPGTDGAVALAMAHHIISSVIGLTTAAAGQTDGSAAAKYLRNANSAAANADNETTWTDAARLVVVAKSAGAPASATVGEYLEAKDYLPASQAANANKAVWSGGAPVEIAAAAVHGDLLPGQQILTGGELGAASITVKTVYQIFYDNVIAPYSVQYYADIAGVNAADLQTVAGEFYAAGKKAVANAYRGTVQHTNGLWSMMSVMFLNALVGNYDWKGGNTSGGGSWSSSYGTMKGANGNTYEGGAYGAGPWGPRIDRAKATGTYSFENLRAAGFDAYPARRPWFPYGTHGNYQEIIPGIAAQYPYACKVLITYWNALPYSTPALKDIFLSTVRDASKIPLFVAIDNQMGEVSSCADYILPDTTYLEKWSFPGSNAANVVKCTPIRQPLVGAFDGRAWDATFDTAGTNAYTPIYPDTKMFEDILLGLMTALGFSKDIANNDLPSNAWAHIKDAVAAIATAVNASTDPGKPGGGALTASDVVARGGAFQDPNKGYYGTEAGETNALYVSKLRYRYGNSIRLYYPELATQLDSMGDGAANMLAPAIAAGGFLAAAHYEAVSDIRGNAVSDATYPYQLITYKKVLHGQARTQNLPWLTCWQTENFIELNASDAASLGLRNYDQARISSPSNISGIVGRVWVTEGLRPGVVAVSHHFGRWAQSSTVWEADGAAITPDASRSMGIQPNLVMRLDPQLGDVSLQDKIGASCSFYDTRVRVEKVVN